MFYSLFELFLMLLCAQNLPYLGAISGGLHHGLMIRITGEMLHHDRFELNFQQNQFDRFH